MPKYVSFNTKSKILTPCFSVKHIFFLGFPICISHSLHIMWIFLLHVPPSLHSLLSLACTENLLYHPLNLDYENDNLISSVSSECYTPYFACPSLHTMRNILRLDLNFCFNLSLILLKLNYVTQIINFCLFLPNF